MPAATSGRRKSSTGCSVSSGGVSDNRIIGYCHIGQQATVVSFVARLLGREVSLYGGSWVPPARAGGWR